MSTTKIFEKTPLASSGALVGAAVAGAVVTAAMGAAAGARAVREEGADTREVVKKVAKESVGAGLALAAGTAVAKTLFRSNILGFLAMAAVSAGAKYAYDEVLAKGCPQKVAKSASESVAKAAAAVSAKLPGKKAPVSVKKDTATTSSTEEA